MLMKNKLEAEMRLHGDTGNSLSAYLGMARSTFSAKLNEKNAEFTSSEILKIKEKYSLTAEKLDDIFFSPEVSKKDTLQ